MKIIKIVTLVAIMAFSSVFAKANDENNDTKVIVGNDTVSMIIPEKNFGRYDRGLKNYLFIPKGEWAFGLTASMGDLMPMMCRFCQ